ncbi:MAG: response regulator, partial [Desulfobulbaceae bacterium]|nr:response regulator [Desulfobulbaceae bacterium]
LYNRHVYGIVGLDLDTAAIDRLTKVSAIQDRGGEIIIFNSHGDILGATGNAPEKTMRSAEMKGLVEKYGTQSGENKEFWSPRKDRIQFFTPVPSRYADTWWVKVGLPRDEIVAKARILSWQLIFVGSACIIAAMLVFFVMSNRIIRPLRLFTEATKEIGHGKYKRFMQGDSSQDEIGKLARAFNEMSEQVEAREEALLKSKEEWKKSFNAIGDIITIQDKDMRIVRANQAAGQFFEVDVEDLVGKFCHEVFLGGPEPCPGCPVRKTIQDINEHSEIIHHVGLGKFFHVSSAPIFDNDNNLEYLVHVAKDITEQKKMEEELFQAHKMEAIGTLAGGIAHDFNNILTAILGYAEIVRADLPESSPSRHDIDQVLKAGNRAKELVKQILTFSRKGQETQQPLQSSLIIKETLKLLRASLPTTIEIQEEIDPECGTILANPTNIHQILVNLCTNALHAMKDEKGILTVRLTRKELTKEHDVISGDGVAEGSFVELMIRDTGHGMDKATVQRMFEPYFTTKEVGKGSGMGLALVHGIVQGCGGFIKVESGPGKGTTFNVYFPAMEEEIVEVEKKQQESLPRGDERILAVDDEEGIIELLKNMLKSLGYEVTAETSSEKTLEVFRTSPDSFDLIITDQTMPHLTGAELAKEILQIRPDIPIILCTGYSAMISEEKAKKIGIKRY